MRITNRLSNTFMVANLISTVLVIAIHYDTKGYISTNAELSLNYLFQEFLTNSIARSAVPLFALMSGFFFFLKWEGYSSYVGNLTKRIRTLLVPYCVASSLIFITYVSAQICIKKQVYEFSVANVARDILLHPQSVQFWYLRDLIILIIVSPLLHSRKQYRTVIIGLALFFAWATEFQVFPKLAGWYLLNIETLFFFWAGGFLSSNRHYLEKLVLIRNKPLLFLLLAWLVIIGGRVYIDPQVNLWYQREFSIASLSLQKTTIITGTIALLGLSSRLTRQSGLYLSGFSFFAFLFHATPIRFLFSQVAGLVVEKQFSFYLEFPLAVVVVFAMAIVSFKFMNPVYSILTGGRGPNRKSEQKSKFDPTDQ